MTVTLAGACRVMDLREGEPARREGLRVWRHVGRETGARAVSLRVLEVEAGAKTPGLVNGDSEEVAFVVEGARPRRARPRAASWCGYGTSRPGRPATAPTAC